MQISLESSRETAIGNKSSWYSNYIDYIVGMVKKFLKRNYQLQRKRDLSKDETIVKRKKQDVERNEIVLEFYTTI